MAAVSWGKDALMLGSLMMLVSGSKVSFPNSFKVLGTFCASGRKSENSASTRAATEMSLCSTSMPAGAVNVRTIGRNEAVASKGASSVSV